MLPTENKIMPFERVAPLPGRKVVLTNGCFDLLHRGHVEYLEHARQLGDMLVVGVNSDASVRRLKGPTRPVNHDVDRARVLAALECVSMVVIFEDDRSIGLMELLKPNVWVKGGDFTIETLPPEEVAAARRSHIEIKIMPVVPGFSTTAILQKSRA